MKRKSFIALTTGLFSLAAIAVSGALILNHTGVLKSFVAHGEPDQGSYTITAADFNVNGNGSLTVGGEHWNFEGASLSGNTVTISGILYTNSFSGSSVANNRRGDGYTRIVISDLDKSQAVGLVLYEKALNQSIKNTIVDITPDLDLTVGGTIAGADRRGLQFAQGVGGSFSFTSMTFYYACTTVTPEVHINEASLSVGVGETGQLTTSTVDVYEGDNPTYAWASSDEDVATVDSTGLVTGVGAGNADITVTMTIGGVNYTDTLGISVTATAATVYEMSILDTSRIEGAGIFCRFSPQSALITADSLDTYTASVDVEFADSNVNNAVNHYVLQEKSDASYTAYVVMDSAVGLNGAFVVTVDFKDNTANEIYRATLHFDNGALDTPIHLSAAAFSVEAGQDLVITASKASWVEGEPTFVFASYDLSVFTVGYDDNVATVHGISEGSAALEVTMTIGSDVYSIQKTISVTAPGVVHNIVWYTEGTGNQVNHIEGAGIWTWVNYGELGYDWAGFSTKASQITVSYVSEPSTTVTVNTISDPIGGNVARVYLLLGAAYNTGTLTMSIPDVNGVTYTGTIEFNAGAAVAYNGVAI